MNKPLGRDHLGRLVYEYDVRAAERSGETLGARIIFPAAINGWIQTMNYHCPAESIEIDLNESPKRSNFERYFADYGTLDEICRVTMDICRSTSDEECDSGCVFNKWSDKECNVAFYDWLKQEATV